MGRRFLTGVMNVLFALAAVLTARVVIEFFGRLAMTAWGSAIIAATDRLVLSVGVTAPRTPYGGVFDTQAAITVVVLLTVEWVLSFVRSRAYSEI
ncbi:MAG: hypothetical protein RBS78_05715 [Coriobacteriia bacterium]|nr:hypothetical protein [Coriobacteriia bacterium]